MAVFNFFEEYRKEHASEGSGIRISIVIEVVLVLAAVCAALYAVTFLKNVRLESSIAYVQGIKTNPEFVLLYDESLELRNACNDIAADSETIAALKEYEIGANIADSELVDAVRSCIADPVYIDSLKVSTTGVVIAGRSEALESIEQSMQTLRDNGTFGNIVCTYAKNDEAGTVTEGTAGYYTFEVSMDFKEEAAEE